MTLRILISALVITAVTALYLYFSNRYYISENKTLFKNVETLKANIITQQSKCEEDIAIEKSNVKIKEVIKYKTKYIKRVVKDEKLTDNKFMLDTNTVQ